MHCGHADSKGSWQILQESLEVSKWFHCQVAMSGGGEVLAVEMIIRTMGGGGGRRVEGMRREMTIRNRRELV